MPDGHRLSFLENLRTFLIFLLGSLCFRKGVFDSERRNMKLYIAVCATACVGSNVLVAAYGRAKTSASAMPVRTPRPAA